VAELGAWLYLRIFVLLVKDVENVLLLKKQQKVFVVM